MVGTTWSSCVLWDKGVKTNLGTLGLYCMPNAINNRGQVVGYFGYSSRYAHAFSWKNGVMTDLGTFGGTVGVAVDISDSGQILATRDSFNPVLWENGAVIELSGMDFAHRINDRGQVVGMCRHHACIWENGVTTELEALSDKFPQSDGLATNNLGQVAGVAVNPETEDTTDSLRAVVWKDGVITDLGAGGGSVAYDINDNGQVVGYNVFYDYGTSFLWQNGVLTHFRQNGLRGINNRGDVLAASLGYSAFLLVKRTPDVDGDGKVACADLAIVRAAFGKRRGQVGIRHQSRCER